MVFFLQSVVAVFASVALIIWTASAFQFTRPRRTDWYMWGWGCVAVATIAQIILLLYQH
jgi:peptidoglycan biosynthesis protein MviN/MurJ (putative lipid II flippase)